MHSQKESCSLWFVQSQGTPSSTAHSKQIDVGIKPLLDEAKVATGDLNDGQVGAEVG